MKEEASDGPIHHERKVEIHESIGVYPVEVFVYKDQFEAFVGIYADHNTDEYDTKLSVDEIRELRDALTRWLDDGGSDV